MASDAAGVLDEAYQRLHKTGPEFDGWLSNHGPMAVEAMARHGHPDRVHPWLDGYLRRLEDFPRGTSPVGPDWQEALGDPRRIADWTAFFRRETAGQPWHQVLGTWWPRLLPGVAAGATHGVIRVGHAVRALLADGEDPDHVTELAHGLAYWAARWQPIPGGETQRWITQAGAGPRPRAATPPVAAELAAVPRIADQSGGIRDRLPQLAGLAGWPTRPAIPAAPEIPAWLAGLTQAAVTGYRQYAHGNPVMLVHAATAPTAILRTLPALDQELWPASATAAWHAAATLMSIYAPARPAAPVTQSTAPTAGEVFARAVSHGDEHVIKFADTAAEVHGRTGDPTALTAAAHAIQLIPRD